MTARSYRGPPSSPENRHIDISNQRRPNNMNKASQVLYVMGQDVWAESPHDSCEHVATVHRHKDDMELVTMPIKKRHKDEMELVNSKMANQEAEIIELKGCLSRENTKIAKLDKKKKLKKRKCVPLKQPPSASLVVSINERSTTPVRKKRRRRRKVML